MTVEEQKKEIERRLKDQDFPACPKCGEPAKVMIPSAEGRIVLSCTNCMDPHENPWAGFVNGYTEFVIEENGEKTLVTPGPSEFA